MLLRVFVFLLIVVSFGSCDYISFKKDTPKQKIDTIVDVKTVDVSPSFQVCDSIIDKTLKTSCFRNTIHQEIASSLQEFDIKVRKPVDETIMVTITIHSDSKVSLKSMNASDHLLEQIPDFKKMIEKSIAKLPKIFPAIKRAIPVTSEYTLPIKVKLHN